MSELLFEHTVEIDFTVFTRCINTVMVDSTNALKSD